MKADMADPDNTDPVLRHSTRLTCMAVDQGQSSYDPRFIRELIPENDTYATGPLVLLYGVDIAKDLDSLPQEKYDLFEETSALPHLTADDTAPVLLTYVSSLDTPVTDRGIGIHHPRFGEALKKEMDALNLDCTFRDGIPKDSPERSDLMFAFIKKHLFENHS